MTFRDRPSMRFDEVVFACHGDQVLPLLADPSDRERDVFSCFTTTTNTAWLHTDGSVLPVQARARASWNYRLAGDADAPPTVTYDLNRLQGLTTPEQVLRDAQPRRRDRRTAGAAPVRLSSPALYTRGHPRAAAVGRRERCQSHALLWRVLALWVSRGRLGFGAQGGPRAWSRVVIDSGLFVGTLRHRRFTPVAHAFTYPLFMVLLDIDRVPELMRVSAVTSYNRWNWASFDDRDHLGDPSRPLRERLVVDAARHGIELPAGPIFLLTHLRYLGYCFNPVSFFYCFDRAEQLQVVLAEVSNTVRRKPPLLAAAGSGLAHVSRGRHEIALRLAVHAGRPGVRVRLHAAGGQPGGAHGDQSGRLGWLRCDAVARAPALERGGDPAGACAVSGDDRAGDGRDSLGGAEIVVEGRARGARASRLTAWENARRTATTGQTGSWRE